jgi:hypothetical protein
MIAEPLAMVGDDRHRNRAGRIALEGLHQLPQLFVHRGDLTEIRLRAIPASEGLGRRVRRVRIEIVDPEEQWLLCGAGQECDCTIGRVSGCALRTAGRQLLVVRIESPREPEGPGQDEGRYEGGGPVPRCLQPFGHDSMCGWQIAGILVHAVAGRIEARHHRGVRGQRLGHGCVRLSEALPSRGEGVERGCFDKDRLRADRVDSRRVEGHEKNGRADGRRCR